MTAASSPDARALGLKLVDEIGGEREAIAWMEHTKDVPHDLPIRDWKTPSSLERLGILERRRRGRGRLGPRGPRRAFLIAAQTYVEARLLDGLVSIWQVGDPIEAERALCARTGKL